MKIGTDIEEIKRFENKDLVKDKKFLERIFTKNELEYSFSKAKPSQHLCARFCAKEALIKALGDKTIPLNKINVQNDKNGKPEIKILDKEINLNFEVSLSHCESYACASVIVY